MTKKTPTPVETDRAEIVLKQAKLSIKHFRSAFDTVRKARKASGPPTAGEQDLIRASLTFAAAGLDSVIKELIKGSIKSLAEKDTDVQKGLEEYARRQLRDDSDGSFAKNRKDQGVRLHDFENTEIVKKSINNRGQTTIVL